MDKSQWLSSAEPGPMIAYLEGAGCYLEFESFYTNCFDRVRAELKTRAIIEAAYDISSDVDELVENARAAIEKMCRRLTSPRIGDEERAGLERELRFSRLVLAREFHDFGEANRHLSSYLIEVADDPKLEAITQADFLRSAYEFPFKSREEE